MKTVTKVTTMDWATLGLIAAAICLAAIAQGCHNCAAHGPERPAPGEVVGLRIAEAEQALGVYGPLYVGKDSFNREVRYYALPDEFSEEVLWVKDGTVVKEQRRFIRPP